jgi:hypothetical protein
MLARALVNDEVSQMSAGFCNRAREVIRHRLGLVLTGCAFAVALLAMPALAEAAPLTIGGFAGTGSSGPTVAGPALSSRLGAPRGVALDAAGDMYIADAGDNQVLKVSPGGGLSVIAGTGAAGAPTPGPATVSPLNGPQGVVVDGAGNVYIADTANHEVERVTPGGTLSIIAGNGTAGRPTPGPATSSHLGGPSGLTLDPAGNLYIADGYGAAGNPEVEKVTPGGTLSVVAGNGTAGTPVAGAATSSHLRGPTGVAVDPAGNLFIADAYANVTEKVSPTGTLSIFAGRTTGAGAPTNGPATSSRLSFPAAVATDTAGDVYIADATNNRVEEVVLTGALSVLAGDGLAAAPAYGTPALSSPLNSPFSLAVSPEGVLYVANSANATVDRLTLSPPTGSGIPAPAGTTTQGQTLTAATGTWTNSPTSFAYQWQDCDPAGANCVNLAGATTATYLLAGADAGHTIRVLVSAANAGGGTAHASTQTAVVLPLAPAGTAPPAISGATTDTQTLTASTGAWANGASGFRYQWQNCDASGAGCAAIGGAVAATYTLAPADVGNTIRVVVTASNAGGKGAQTSSPTGVIAPALLPWANTPPPAVTRAPVVTVTARVGQSLTCSVGVWTSAPTGYRYQWTRSNAIITGAMSPTYTVAAADRGRSLACMVTATNAGGAISATSNRIAVPSGAATSARRRLRAVHHARRNRHAVRRSTRVRR